MAHSMRRGLIEWLVVVGDQVVQNVVGFLKGPTTPQTASTYLNGDVVTIVLGILRLFVHHHGIPRHDRPRSLTPLVVLGAAAAGAHHPLAGIGVLDPSTPARDAMLRNVASLDLHR
jgi:hypothetical protein